MNIMMWWIPLLLVQDVHLQAERARAAMQASLEKQRLSVQLQLKAAAATGKIAVWRPSDAAFPVEFPCQPVEKTELDKMIDDVAHTQSVDPALVREVAREESNFYPCAVSPKGAAGLMQLMPETQAQFQVLNPLDAQESLQAGAKLLKQLMDRYQGNLPLVLSAYNAGIARIGQPARVPEIPETKQYVSDIMGRLQR